ncbi:MAG: S1/P1 nuclease [Bryobacteraceae bacterium]|jgi:hypothetical protein
MRKFAVVAVIAGCLPTFAWGPEGHSLVARIADAQLTPAARARVIAILGPNTTMVSISSWADEVRRSRPATAPWHFIDIPIDKPHLDMARDCPKGDCVIAKIEDFRKALNDAAITPAERREDLMFLIHFVGDMHQPLHCSDNKDKGGNGVRVDFFGRQMNLHSVWDSGLLSRIGTEEQLFGPLSKESARHAKKWSKGTVADWAEQAHKASQKIVYGRLPKVAAGTPVPINAAYEKKADPLIREQIEKAGARLAAVLNATLK